MALSLQYLLDAPIIELDSIDSTNNYAMRLVDADTAQPGLTIVAREQTHGKGQRGRKWQDDAGQSLLMSVLVVPEYSLDRQSLFNMRVAVAIADTIQNLYEGWDVRIKWPNDIIINDKKAGGVLIENVLRGSNWVYSIIGFGLNVQQENMPIDLPYSTSLKIECGKPFGVMDMCKQVRAEIFKNLLTRLPDDVTLQKYNDHLYRTGQVQQFYDDDREWKGVIDGVTMTGELRVLLAGGERVSYQHGAANWKWE